MLKKKYTLHQIRAFLRQAQLREEDVESILNLPLTTYNNRSIKDLYQDESKDYTQDIIFVLKEAFGSNVHE